MIREAIGDLVTLRSGYGTPSERVAKKVLPRLGQHMRGRVTPRGCPGFVRVIDEATLAIPDRPGNNRIDSSQNLLVDPHGGMIFFIPGVNRFGGDLAERERHFEEGYRHKLY